MLSHHFMSIISVIKYGCQGWIIPQTKLWSHTTTKTYLAVTLNIGTKSLDHGPRHWYWGPRTITQVWKCYPTISWVLYEECNTSNGCRSPPRLQYDHKLHPGHNQLLPWILEPRAWTMDLISGIVVQGWWCMYGYGIPLFHECYMSHAPYLTGMDHLPEHTMTSNYSLDILSWYPSFWNQELEPWTLSVL